MAEPVTTAERCAQCGQLLGPTRYWIPTTPLGGTYRVLCSACVAVAPTDEPVGGYDELVKRLRDIADYACFDSAEGRHRSDPANHPAAKAATAIEALQRQLAEAREENERLRWRGLPSIPQWNDLPEELRVKFVDRGEFYAPSGGDLAHALYNDIRDGLASAPPARALEPKP